MMMIMMNQGNIGSTETSYVKGDIPNNNSILFLILLNDESTKMYRALSKKIELPSKEEKCIEIAQRGVRTASLRIFAAISLLV
jgi:hypothetical protein